VEEVVKNLPVEIEQVDEKKGDDDEPSGGDVPEPKGLSETGGSSGTSTEGTAVHDTADDGETDVGFAVIPPAEIEHATEDINAVEAAAGQSEQAELETKENTSHLTESAVVEEAGSAESAESQEISSSTANTAENIKAESSSTPEVSYADAVAMMSAPVAPELTQVPPPITEEVSSSTPSPAPTPAAASQAVASPEKVPFPLMPRMSTSTSTHSNLSEIDQPTSPSGSTPDLLSDAGGTPGDKRRKRLSSIKGFVRRISDQGVGRSKSGSGSGSGPKSPMAEVDEVTAMLVNASEQEGKGDKVKKRLSLKRGN
jgi:hypothetical protein